MLPPSSKSRASRARRSLPGRSFTAAERGAGVVPPAGPRHAAYNMSGAAPELAAVRMRPEHLALDLTRLEGGRVNMSPARPLAPALARSALAVTITWLCLAAASPGVGAPLKEIGRASCRGRGWVALGAGGCES